MPTPTSLPIRDKRTDDQAWVERLLRQRWGSTQIITRGELLDAATLPALVAGERQGLATWRRLDERAAELVTLDAVTQRQGIGTALLATLVERLRVEGVVALHVTTTNDNLDALRYYQRRGFLIAAMRPRAVDESRRSKPSIPAIGAYGIPPRDEIELRLEFLAPGLRRLRLPQRRADRGSSPAAAAARPTARAGSSGSCRAA